MLEKTLMLRKIEGKRRGQQVIRWLDSITNSMDMSLHKPQGMAEDSAAGCAGADGVTRKLIAVVD